jgi:hypothetical protein
MTNHDMLVAAVADYRGKVLTTAEIRQIVRKAFPQFSDGSMLPNDHARGNKRPCRCAGTSRRIFDHVERGHYRVR